MLLESKKQANIACSGQGRAFASPLGIQRLWRILLLGFSCQIPPLPLTPAVSHLPRNQKESEY